MDQAAKDSLSKLLRYFQALDTLNRGQTTVFGKLESLEGFLSSLGSLPHRDLSQLDQKLSHMAKALNVESLGPNLRSIKGEEEPEVVPWSFSSDEVKDIVSTIEHVKSVIEDIREKGKNFPDSTIKVNVQGNSIGKTKSFLCHNKVYNNYYYKSSDEVLEAVEKIVAQVDLVERQKLAEWISPLDFSDQLSKYLEKIAHGTFQWFFKQTGYFLWRGGRTRELWCPGHFGVGKTLLASNVIENLQHQFNTANCAVLYLYFSHKETYTLHELVACLLRQLVYPRLTQSDLVESLRADQQQNRSRSSQKVSDLLHREIETYQRVFIVIDALDEYPENFRKPFMDMLRNLPSNASLLVTSRHIPSTAEYFQTHRCYPRIADLLGALDLQNEDLTSNIPLSPLVLWLESLPNLICPITSWNSDIKTAVFQRISTNLRLQSLISKSRYSSANIAAKIVEKASGMFLLADLHLDSLGSQTNALGFKRALEQLPSTLDAAYDALLHNRVDSQSPLDRDLAYRVISWVFFAWRPLNLPELQHALATPTAAKEGLIELTEVVDDPDVILSSCAGLVIKDAGGHIRFRHQTIHEYFQRLYCHAPSSFIPPAQLVECCLEYHTKYSDSALDNRPTSDRRKWMWDYNHLNFSQYASDWYKHLPDDFEVLEKLIPAVIRLMPPVIIWAEDESKLDLKLFQRLIDQGQLTTLRLAAFSGLVSAAKTATVHSHRDLIADALVIALLANQSEVAQFLASSPSLDLNWQDPNGYTPLIVASMSCLYEVVELLLARPGIDVNIQDKSGKTALIAATDSKWNRANIVKLLLGVPNIQVNSRDTRGFSALMTAVAYKQGERADIVKLLLDVPNIQVNYRDTSGHSALMIAVASDSEKADCVQVVKLLLGVPNIHVNYRDTAGRSALMIAAAAGSANVVRLLLSTRSSITTASTIPQKGDQDSVVDINARDQRGYTALMCGLGIHGGRGSFHCLMLLLQDPAVRAAGQDGSQCTALLLAVIACKWWGLRPLPREDVIKRLLALQDVNINATDRQGYSALYHARYGNGIDPTGRIPSFLLRAGAEPVGLLATNPDAVQRLIALTEGESLTPNPLEDSQSWVLVDADGQSL
ncbi:hypothetical protein C8J56DRAFT_952863 [Mycena floridula]|nr:hypothetical protein C8J56DRAFT_952863 [Mycena floridula]